MSRFLAPEWAAQTATILVWPRDNADWGTGLEDARTAIAAMTTSLCRFQDVLLVAPDGECRRSIDAAFNRSPDAARGLKVIQMPANDIWARDTGPLTVIEKKSRIFVDFRFDGWGGQFDARDDDRLTGRLHAAGALGNGTLDSQTATLEGGSIEANGNGALLTSERCLLAGRRNAGISRPQAEQLLVETLGVELIHWLTAGDLIGDDTDGHIDTLARFVSADTIVYQGCRDPGDAHYAPLAAMAGELRALSGSGQPYRLIELPLPAPQYDRDDGHRLPAGYANFLIANGCVLVPAFDDSADATARAILAGCFPEREIVSIDSRPLIRQHGGLHCAAMQVPAEPNHA